MNTSDWNLVALLAKEHNISRVGELLFLSQPALSYRLKKMEAEFGVQLFCRSHNGITFTAAGDILASFAHRFQQLSNQLSDSLLQMGSIDCGQLTLGITSAFANHLLPNLISKYCERYPKVDLSIRSNKSSIIFEELQNGVFNIAIVRGTFVWPETKILLCEEPIYIVSDKPINRDCLPDLPYIAAPQSGIYPETIDWWNENYLSIPTKVIMSVNDMETALQMVSHGLGWTFLPAIFVNKNTSLFREALHRNNGELITRKTWILCRASVSNAPLINNFIKFVMDNIAKKNADDCDCQIL